MVVVADHARDLSGAVFILPELDEAGLAQGVRDLTRMMKPVHAQFECTIPFHGIDLQCARHKFARDFTADIFLDRLDQRRPAEGVASFVMIKTRCFRQ